MADTQDKKRLVFISYGGKIDAKIAELLCEFLQQYLGYTESVYCTATKDNKTATPYGEDFSKSYMQNIYESKIFIPLLSDNYMISKTALIEMGAAYALGKKFIPFLVSGCDYDKLQPLYNVRSQEMHRIEEFEGFLKAMQEIGNSLGGTTHLSDEKCKNLIREIKKLKTDYKTNIFKQKQISFSCNKLFKDKQEFEKFLDKLRKRKIVDINITSYISGEVKCDFYFKDSKNVSDVISVLEELGYNDTEYKFTELNGRL